MCLSIPGKVKTVKNHQAIIDYYGREGRAKDDLVEVKAGDWVITQAGFVVQKLSHKEAQKILNYFDL